MKTVSLKISVLLCLTIGCSIFTISNKIDYPPVEVLAYNPAHITTVIRPSADALARLPHHEEEVEIVLIKDLYIDEHGILYGNTTNEIGHIFVRPDTWSGILFHWMDHLEVRPEYRQQGYGAQLFNAAVDCCQRQGSSSMRWTVGANAAYGSAEKMLTQQTLREFYQKRGGKTTNGYGFWLDFAQQK